MEGVVIDLVDKPYKAPALPTGHGEEPATSAESTEQNVRAGRKSKFNSAEDLIIFQEVAAAEAHIAIHGEVIASFECAATKINSNSNFEKLVTGKNVQDRFKNLLASFQSRDATDGLRSGTGGEIGELEELLGDISEAERDLSAKRQVDVDLRTKQEKKKVAAGKELILRALHGRKKSATDKDTDEKEGDTPRQRRRIDRTDGMSLFSESLRESDVVCFEVERQRLDLDREKMKKEAEERAADRVERAQKRLDRMTHMRAQQETMEQMRKDSSEQMPAVLGLVNTLMKRK